MIIGSKALLHHFPEFKRIPKDIDVIRCSHKIDETNLRIEYHDCPPLVSYYNNDCPVFLGKDELYTLKCSHLFWNINWEKHIYDVQFLKEKGCKLINSLFLDLFNYWSSYHGSRKISDTDMTSEEFFDNAIKFPVKHDLIHEMLITHPYFQGQKFPTYVKILKEGAEVDVCMNKFQFLSELEKFNIVFEEVAVMALERNPYSSYYKSDYIRMLKKFVLSHAKLEEALWIVQNYKELHNIPFNYKQYIYGQISIGI